MDYPNKRLLHVATEMTADGIRSALREIAAGEARNRLARRSRRHECHWHALTE